MPSQPSHRSLMVVDVENSRSRDDRSKQVMRTGLYEAVRSAFREAGIDFDDLGYENLGDGVLVVIPSTVDKVPIVDHVVGRLQVALHQHNTTVGAAAPIRIRLALHAGEVTQDQEGWSGADLDHVFALSKSDVLRRVLARSTRTNIAVIASRTIYQAVLRHGYGPPDLAFVHEIAVGPEPAWIWVPGYRNPAGLDEPAGDEPAGENRPGRDDERPPGAAAPDPEPAAEPAVPVDASGDHQSGGVRAGSISTAGGHVIGGDWNQGGGPR